MSEFETKEFEADEETMKKITGGLIDLFLLLNKDATDEFQKSCDVSFIVGDKVGVKAHVIFDIWREENEGRTQ